VCVRACVRVRARVCARVLSAMPFVKALLNDVRNLCLY